MAQRQGVSPDADVGRSPRWTSGRECWVFRAETPDELCGHHPELIGPALAPREALQYLLYSPIFDATDGPFHVGGTPGSHSVALTSRRLLISRDPHTETGRRWVHSIDLGSVSSMEIGSALALAWFVVHFVGPAGPAACSVLFSANGLDHFRAVVRGYLAQGRPPHPPEASSLDWSSTWSEAPAFLRSELAPLARETPPPLAALPTPERWSAGGRSGRGRTACLSAAGVLAATPLGLLWAASEARTRPDGLSFGVNVTAVRRDRVADASVSTRPVHGTALPVLLVKAGEAPDATELVVPFGEHDRGSAETIVHLASAWRGGR